MLSTIQVSDIAVLAYTDTGAPQSTAYTTVFAIHGLGFSSPIFQKLADRLYLNGVRFVSINRRNYSGSTPWTESEIAVVNNGTDEEKSAFLEDRSREFATFISKFIELNSLPAISIDRKTGGVVVLGWSLGALSALSIPAFLSSYLAHIQASLQSHLLSVIMLDPAPISLGVPSVPQEWNSFTDPAIPDHERLSVFIPWVASYFNHGDITTRNPDTLTYIAPSIDRVPTIHSMSAAEREAILETGPSAIDGRMVFTTQPQLRSIYHSACFDPEIRALLPQMKITQILGGSSPAFAILGWWAVEADDKKAGGGLVDAKVIPGVNHFLHWDDPEPTAQAIIDAIAA